MRTQDVTLKTCQRRWMIGRSGERGSGITVLAARHDDDRYYFSEVEIKYYDRWKLVSVSALINVINAIIGNIGMLICPRTLKLLNSIERIHYRIICASFDDNPCTTIVSSSTNASGGMDIVKFYSQLSSFVWYIPKYNVLIIDGDMNAYLGKDGNDKFCLHISSKRNRDYQAEFYSGTGLPVYSYTPI